MGTEEVRGEIKVAKDKTNKVTETALVVSPQDQFMKELNIDEGLAQKLKLLSSEVINFQMQSGRIAIQTGKQIKQIKDLLTETNPELWQRWLDHFAWSKDYASRMIRIGEAFDENTVADNLTFRHLREIDRYREVGDKDLLQKIVSEHSLNTNQTRKLITNLNQGKVDLKELMENNPDVKSAVNDIIKQSTSETRSKNEELKSKLREMGEKEEEKSKELSNLQEDKTGLINQVNLRRASIQMGEGNEELGLMKIELEQKIQQLGAMGESVKELTQDLRQVRINYETLRNSPVGIAKQDMRKTFDDITKFFSHTMTPTMVLKRIQGLDNEESKNELAKVLELLSNWVTEMANGLGRVPEQLLIEAPQE